MHEQRVAAPSEAALGVRGISCAAIFFVLSSILDSIGRGFGAIDTTSLTTLAGEATGRSTLYTSLLMTLDFASSLLAVPFAPLLVAYVGTPQLLFWCQVPNSLVWGLVGLAVVLGAPPLAVLLPAAFVTGAAAGLFGVLNAALVKAYLSPGNLAKGFALLGLVCGVSYAIGAVASG